MSRGIRALIAGGMKGYGERQERERIEAERKADKDERRRLTIARLALDNPRALGDVMTAPPPAKSPEIVAPRVGILGELGPMPRVGEQRAPMRTQDQAPVPVELSQATRAGVDSLRRASIETMTEEDAIGRISSQQQTDATERDAKNRAAHEQLNKAYKDGLPTYDPAADYSKELVAYHKRDRVAQALVKAGLATPEEAQVLAETGENLTLMRQQAEERDARIAASKERADPARQAPVPGTPAYYAMKNEEAAIAARHRPKPVGISGRATSTASGQRARGTYLRSRVRELMRPTKDDNDLPVPGLKRSEALRQATEEWELTEEGATELDDEGNERADPGDSDFADVSADSSSVAPVKEEISQAEYQALLASGHTAPRIKSKYTVRR